MLVFYDMMFLHPMQNTKQMRVKCLMRKKISELHEKRPYLDPLINMSLGAIGGGFWGQTISMSATGVKIWTNMFFWLAIGMIAITYVYFKFFSIYSYSRTPSPQKALNDALTKKFVEHIEQSSNVDVLEHITDMANVCFDKLKLGENND